MAASTYDQRVEALNQAIRIRNPEMNPAKPAELVADAEVLLAFLAGS